MAELIRQIEQEDIPRLHKLMEIVFQNGGWKEITRLGGMTNRSYRIRRDDGAEYLVRIPGEGTSELINRSDEKRSLELACRLGIDSKLLYFDEEGCKVMEFIHNPQPMNEEVLKKKENLHQVAQIFYRLHTCGEDTGVDFDVFKMAMLYERIVHENSVNIFDDYTIIKNTVMNIKDSIDRVNKVDKVPCHNDSLVGNWVLDGTGKLFLIDWEYSGMNEAMWDLSCFSIEADCSEKEDDELLKAYYRLLHQSVGVFEKKYFTATKLYVDYLWTLWGLTRVPYDGEFMREYAYDRYIRLKKNLKSFEALF